MDDDTQPLCSVIRPKITADCVGDEKFYPVNSTLYDHSTHPMKLCVPLLTPPDDHAVEHGHSAGLRPPRMAQETRSGWGPCLDLAGS